MQTNIANNKSEMKTKQCSKHKIIIKTKIHKLILIIDIKLKLTQQETDKVCVSSFKVYMPGLL